MNFLCHSTLDLGRDPLIRGKQVMEIKHTLKEPRSLADPVLTAGYTRELHLRDVSWKQANSKLHARMLFIYKADIKLGKLFSFFEVHL